MRDARASRRRAKAEVAVAKGFDAALFQLRAAGMLRDYGRTVVLRQPVRGGILDAGSKKNALPYSTVLAVAYSRVRRQNDLCRAFSLKKDALIKKHEDSNNLVAVQEKTIYKNKRRNTIQRNVVLIQKSRRPSRVRRLRRRIALSKATRRFCARSLRSSRRVGHGRSLLVSWAIAPSMSSTCQCWDWRRILI